MASREAAIVQDCGDMFAVHYRERWFFGLLWSGWKEVRTGRQDCWSRERAEQLAESAVTNGVIHNTYYVQVIEGIHDGDG